jgi:hypothetical protein
MMIKQIVIDSFVLRGVWVQNCKPGVNVKISNIINYL